jgi:biotin carboxyl carrier protein
MKLYAEIGDQKHEVEIRREGDRVIASVDDRTYELEASEPEANVYLFKHEGRVYEASVTEPKSSGDSTQVRVDTHDFDIKLVDPKRLRGSGGGHELGDGLAEIKTAMPGKIVRILLQPGDSVEAGAGILVVEAMKMQNELKSPKNGVVKEVRVEEGAAVAAGDVLATVE